MQATDGAVALRLGFMRNVLSMARQPPANPSDTFLKPFDTATGVRNEEDSGEVVSPMSTAESSSFRIPAGIAIEDEAVVVSDEPQLVEQECNEVATKVRCQGRVYPVLSRSMWFTWDLDVYVRRKPLSEIPVMYLCVNYHAWKKEEWDTSHHVVMCCGGPRDFLQLLSAYCIVSVQLISLI